MEIKPACVKKHFCKICFFCKTRVVTQMYSSVKSRVRQTKSCATGVPGVGQNYKLLKSNAPVGKISW